MLRVPVFRHQLVVLACVLVIVTLTGCNDETDETPAYRPALRVLSARGRLEEALRLSERWREDAELREIQANVLGPAQIGPLHLDFTFESPSENRLIYSVMCFPSGCEGREFVVSTTYGWEAIEFRDDMIDSVEAAAIGHHAGGKRFANLKGATMWVRLGRDTPRDVGPTVWLAYYSRMSEPLYVVIDPYTGEVIRTE